LARYDIVLYGATGFTGALVAQYLARNAEGTRWAIAGRDASKLNAVAQSLPEPPPILIADASKPDTLDALAAGARVVCSTVGPYARHGSALVAACVRAGTHTCDLTGEAQWMAAMIAAHHEEAKRTGARVVHACGFDSVPSDIGAATAIAAYARRFNARPTSVKLYVRKASGGVSGGTLASMMELLDQASGDRAIRKILADPYSLLPAGAARGPDVNDLAGVSWDDAEQSWTAPFVMAASNAKVVRRTLALGDPSGNAELRYEERSSFGAGVGGAAKAAMMTAGLGAFTAAVSTGPGRAIVGPWLPQPGQGPNETARTNGYFEMDVVARGPLGEARVRVHGDKDPGYGSTSGMIAEAALALASTPSGAEGGVLTPAFAFGVGFAERLVRAGVTFTER
jgi:short subunit dehydrogenase-like uncharacterized protein